MMQIGRDSAGLADFRRARSGSHEGFRCAGWAYLALLVGALSACGSGNKEPKDATTARTDTEQRSSYTVTTQVGAERGQALTDESQAKLTLNVDLGTDAELPAGSKLVVLVSDVTDKETPTEMLRQELDVSGKKDTIEITVMVPAKLLVASERVAVSGRITDKGEMRAISSVPLVVDGPFSLDGDVAKVPRDEQLALSLTEAPDYKRHHSPRRIVVPNYDVRSVDTGKPTSVEGPANGD